MSDFMEEQNRIGLIGLGSMGSNIAKVLLRDNYSITVYNQSNSKYSQFTGNDNVQRSDSIEDFAEKLQRSGSAIVWLMIPGGSPTNSIVDRLSELLKEGSIVIDGSNSKYEDSMANYKKMKLKAISYLDVGVAGGPDDLLKGVALSVGGDMDAFEKAEPVLKAVAGEGTYEHVGGSGQGHWWKGAHNAYFYSIYPKAAQIAKLMMDRQGLDVQKALKLFATAPPITTGIPQSILDAYESGLITGKVQPEIPVSKMVSSFVDKEVSEGADLTLIREALRCYPTMSEGTKSVMNPAKKKLTGH